MPRSIRFVAATGLLGLAGAVLGAAPSHAQADPATGEKLFQQRCSVCHTLSAAEKKPTGPHLEKLLGRKAGADAAYGYSAAMTASGIVWNEKTLNDYLANPGKVVPGTSMPLAVPRAADREDIIAYLEAKTK